MEWAFRVSLSDVRASKLCTVDQQPGMAPLFRLDFDGKVIQSAACTSPGDPKWTERHSFEYRLVEPDLQAAVASLAARVAAFDVFFVPPAGGGENGAHVGRATMDLFNLCTGASDLKVTLMNPTLDSTPAGVLQCTLCVEQLAPCAIGVASLTLHGLPDAAPMMLACCLADDDGAPVESRVAPATTSPQFENLPRITARCSLRDLTANTLRIQVIDVAHGGATAGVLELPLSDLVHSTADHTAHFKKNLYGDPSFRRRFTALAEGIIAFADLPRLAPLQAGENVDGQCYGKPLLPSCLLPAKFSKFPQRLPDFKSQGPIPTPVQRASAVDTAGGADTSLYATPGGNRAAGQPLPPGNDPSYAYDQAGPAYQNQSGVAGPDAGRSSAAHAAYAAVAATQSYTNQAEPLGQPRATNVPSNATAPGNSALTQRSPLANASTALMEQHQEALRAIEEQRHKSAEAVAALELRTAREVQSEKVRMEAIVAEERVVREQLEGCNRRADEIRRANDELAATVQAQQQSGAADTASLEAELSEMDGLEAQLQQMLSQLRARADADAQAQRLARAQAAEAQRRLAADRNAFHMMDSQLRQQQDQLLQQQRSLQQRREEVTVMQSAREQQADEYQRNLMSSMAAPAHHSLQHPDGAPSTSATVGAVAPAAPAALSSHPNTPRGHTSYVQPPPIPPSALSNVAPVDSIPRQPTRADQYPPLPAPTPQLGDPNHALAQLRQQQRDAQSRQDSMLVRAAEAAITAPVSQLPPLPETRHRSPTRIPRPQPLGGATGVLASASRAAASPQHYDVGGLSPPRGGARSAVRFQQQQGADSLNGSVASAVRHVSQHPTPVQQPLLQSSVAAAVTQAPLPLAAPAGLPDLYSAIAHGNSAAFERTVDAYGPQCVRGDNLLLVRACAQPAPNARIVEALLKLRPELVHIVEPKTAATALHCACAAVHPDASVVQRLLSNGANPCLFNADGRTAFHVALTNPSDQRCGHVLARALVTAGGVQVANQPTTAGATPAHLCAASDANTASLRFLADTGALLTAPAPIDLPDGGTATLTPLQTASMHGARDNATILQHFS